VDAGAVQAAVQGAVQGVARIATPAGTPAPAGPASTRAPRTMAKVAVWMGMVGVAGAMRARGGAGPVVAAAQELVCPLVAAGLAALALVALAAGAVALSGARAPLTCWSRRCTVAAWSSCGAQAVGCPPAAATGRSDNASAFALRMWRPRTSTGARARAHVHGRRGSHGRFSRTGTALHTRARRWARVGCWRAVRWWPADQRWLGLVGGFLCSCSCMVATDPPVCAMWLLVPPSTHGQAGRVC
jgi:hypothetical protein